MTTEQTQGQPATRPSEVRSDALVDKYGGKLWCDLGDDLERAEFLECGRAYDTGIVAPVMVDELAEVFRYRHKHLPNDKEHRT